MPELNNRRQVGGVLGMHRPLVISRASSGVTAAHSSLTLLIQSSSFAVGFNTSADRL